MAPDLAGNATTANNDGYSDAELGAAGAEMDGFDESVMLVGGNLARDDAPGPTTLLAAEAARPNEEPVGA